MVLAGTTQGVAVGERGVVNPSTDRLQSDEELVRLVAQGDTDSFRLLVERHADRWFALALRLLARRDVAEDVVQDVFMHLWSKPGSFRPIGARFSTWAHRVVVNRCLDRLRQSANATMPVDVELADPGKGALSGMIEAERDQRLRNEIARLPERQRVAISLTYSSELANKEAAEVMDISLKAFEALLVRAKRTLRENLADLGRGES